MKQQELTDNSPQTIGFALFKITTEQFAILENNFVEKAEIKIELNIRFAADRNRKMIGAFTAFSYEINKQPFLILEAGCHFNIEPSAWDKMYDETKSQIIVPKGFLHHMAMLTVGTSRGILHTKTENTKFNLYHLPTINVADLIKQDKVIKFK